MPKKLLELFNEKTKYSTVGAISLCALLCAGSAATAASFNCRYAKSPDEVLICQDGALSALDEELSAAYASRRKEFSGAELQRFEAMRYKWFARRKACGYDAGCIRRVYRGWISATENFY